MKKLLRKLENIYTRLQEKHSCAYGTQKKMKIGKRSSVRYQWSGFR